MALDQHGAVAVGQFTHAEYVTAAELGQIVQRIHAALGDLLALRHLGPTRERHSIEIARQTDAGAEHDGLLTAQQVRQLALIIKDVLDGHD